MNKQSIAKLELFLKGLEERILGQEEYFIGINAEYKSGLKSYPAEITLKDKKIVIQFAGRTEKVEISWLSARLAKFAENYDSLQLTYKERGTTILIEADNKNVKTKYIDKPTLPPADSSARSYLIKVGEADSLLKEIGIISADGKLRNDMIRKYNQIDHFVELIAPMLENLGEQKCINVLDCGCGKSYLSFVLNYYIRDVLKKPCHFIGIDVSSGVIEASRKMAANLGYHNMTFHNTDIRSYSPDRDIHFVISLHACDTATDEALAAAIRFGARAIAAVPCCHRELLGQYSLSELAPVLKHGILKARIADALTEGMRALFLEGMGYKVSVVEYISPLETPKNLLIRAEKPAGSHAHTHTHASVTESDHKTAEADNTNGENKTRKEFMAEYRAVREFLGSKPMLERLVYEEEY